MTRSQYIHYGVIALTVILFSSCEVLKSKRAATSDSTAIRIIDSLRVLRNDAGSKSDSTWWREIINFLPRDSTYIEKTTQLRPTYITQPVQIIREGGTINREDWQRLLDSMSLNKKDTTSIKTTEFTKEKKTKVLNFWQILAIGLIVLVVIMLAGKYFKITRVIK